MEGNSNPKSIIQRIKNALTCDLSELLDAVTNQTRDVTGETHEAYCIRVDPGHERTALEIRNALKAESYRFNFKKQQESYLFTVYGDLKRWYEKLRQEDSPLLDQMDFAQAF